MSLHSLQKNWEGFAQIDPLWAICVDSSRAGNMWTREEFFATGVTEVDRVIDHVRKLGLSPDANAPALDFGCGVGRLTRSLNRYFPECWGVDISPTMVRLAKEFNQDRPGCRFWLNEDDDLSKLPNEKFGFIYSSIVLQHIQRKYAKRYLSAMIRVLRRDGILVFQVPERERAPFISKVRNKVGFRRRISRLLGRRSVNAFHMTMHCFPEKGIRALLSGQPVCLVDVSLTNSSTGGFNGDLRFLPREPEQGFVSKQYCLVKTRVPAGPNCCRGEA
jgi:SAM-dependent methyltransferase